MQRHESLHTLRKKRGIRSNRHAPVSSSQYAMSFEAALETHSTTYPRQGSIPLASWNSTASGNRHAGGVLWILNLSTGRIHAGSLAMQYRLSCTPGTEHLHLRSNWMSKGGGPSTVYSEGATMGSRQGSQRRGSNSPSNGSHTKAYSEGATLSSRHHIPLASWNSTGNWQGGVLWI